MRTGTGLGMILDGKNGSVPETQPLDRTIEQGTVRNLDMIGDACIGYGKTVVLAGDLYFTGRFIAHWMIAATMAEPEFEGREPQRLSQ